MDWEERHHYLFERRSLNPETFIELEKEHALQIQQARTTIEDLQGKLASYQGRLDEQLERAESDKRKWIQEKKEDEEVIKKLNACLQQVHRANDESQRTIMAMTTERVTSKLQAKNFKEQRDRYKVEKESIERALHDTQKLLIERCHEGIDLKEKNKKLEAQKIKWQELISAKDRQIRQKTDEVLSMHTNNTQLKAINGQLQKQCEQKEQRSRSVSQAQKEAELELLVAKQKLERLEGVQSYCSNLSQMNQQTSFSHGQTQQRVRFLSEANQKLRTQNQLLMEEKKAKEKAQGKVHELESSLEKLKESLSNYAQSHQLSSKKCGVLEKQLKSVSQALQEAELKLQRFEGLVQQLDKASSDKERLERVLEEERKNFTEKMAHSQGFEARMKDMTAQLNSCKKIMKKEGAEQNKILYDLLKTKEKELLVANVRSNGIEKSMKDARQEIEELKGQLEQAEKSIEQYRAREAKWLPYMREETEKEARFRKSEELRQRTENIYKCKSPRKNKRSRLNVTLQTSKTRAHQKAKNNEQKPAKEQVECGKLFIDALNGSLMTRNRSSPNIAQKKGDEGRVTKRVGQIKMLK